MQVQTTKGLVDFDKLEIKDIIDTRENARVTATEWYLDGELVRRDAHVNFLRAQDISSTGGQIG